jgi:hypothetical protein
MWPTSLYALLSIGQYIAFNGISVPEIPPPERPFYKLLDVSVDHNHAGRRS